MFSALWLGYLDSNQGMPGSKPGALPLGDTPPENNTLKLKPETKPVQLDLSITDEENGAGGET